MEEVRQTSSIKYQSQHDTAQINYMIFPYPCKKKLTFHPPQIYSIDQTVGGGWRVMGEGESEESISSSEGI